MSHPKFVVRILRRLGYVPHKITRNLWCAWCGNPFTWTGNTEDEHPKFCSPTHKKRAQEARKKRRENAQTPKKVKIVKKTTRPDPVIDLSQVGKCPTPFKITFRTREEAEVVIKRVDPTMHTYKCECGGLHIGHRKKSRK